MSRKRCSPAEFEERFWSHVNKTDGCWWWTGCCCGGTGRYPYGEVSRNGKNEKAHRVSYEMAFGPIPDGMIVCHRCDNPKCVRPDHLFLGTHLENTHDMMHKGRGGFASKLTQTEALEIRTRRAKGERLQTLADDYGCSISTISLIAHGRCWKTVGGEKNG